MANQSTPHLAAAIVARRRFDLACDIFIAVDVDDEPAYSYARANVEAARLALLAAARKVGAPLAVSLIYGGAL